MSDILALGVVKASSEIVERSPRTVEASFSRVQLVDQSCPLGVGEVPLRRVWDYEKLQYYRGFLDFHSLGR